MGIIFEIKQLFQQTSLISEDASSSLQMESAESNLRDVSRNNNLEHGIDEEKSSHDDLYNVPIQLFSPEASIFERNANNMINNIRKKSRGNTWFNPFERRRNNQWKYLHDGRVPKKLTMSVRKVENM